MSLLSIIKLIDYSLSYIRYNYFNLFFTQCHTSAILESTVNSLSTIGHWISQRKFEFSFRPRCHGPLYPFLWSLITMDTGLDQELEVGVPFIIYSFLSVKDRDVIPGGGSFHFHELRPNTHFKDSPLGELM